VVVASFLGWALDAFDFFLMVFVFSDVAKESITSITTVTVAVTLTLAMRPVGALIFGRLADHYGRRPLLMISILCFSILELLSGLAPNLASFLVLRALFGVAMGGEWGIGSSLTMETILRNGAAGSPGCCNPATLPAISSPQSPSTSCFP
jgi:MFS transporter, SHS family, lactate transporter